MPSIVAKCSLLIPHSGPSGEASTKSPTTVKLEDVEYSDLSFTCASVSSPFQSSLSVGSLRHVLYKDNAEFVFRIIEISDIQRQVSFELIETDATVNVSSVLHTIQLHEITETNETLVTWTTDFSGDCDMHVYNDCKYKKLDAFKDMRNVFQ